MKWHYENERPHVNCYPNGNVVMQIIGIVLIAVGLLLLFICVPGWAWAAIIGFALIIAGYFLLRINSGGR